MTQVHETTTPERRWPAATVGLIALNIVIFFAVESGYFGDPLTVKRGFALIPRVLFGEAKLASWIVTPPAPLTLVTSLFFHSTTSHLLGNMLFLFVFGSAVEAAMDSFFFLLFYLSCGVASGVVMAYMEPGSVTPLIGASGAISGVCAAYLLLYARSAVAGIRKGVLTSFYAQAWLLVGAWILLQFYSAFAEPQRHVAFVAHVGGILAGLLWAPLFRRPPARAKA